MGRDFEDYAVTVRAAEFGGAIQVAGRVLDESRLGIPTISAIWLGTEGIDRHKLPGQIYFPYRSKALRYAIERSARIAGNVDWVSTRQRPLRRKQGYCFLVTTPS